MNTEKEIVLVPEIDEKEIIKFMDSTGVGKSLLQNEKVQFIEICKLYKLNPFKKEIYCVAYGEGKYRNLSIITGYEVYLKRAERTGKLDGWDVTTTGKIADNSLKALLTIHRKDWSHPFKHEVYYGEYVQKTNQGVVTKFWKEKAITMLKKVCISQGFRLCFSDELGGMPYSGEELPDNMTTIQPEKDDIVIDTNKPAPKKDIKIKKESAPDKVEPEENQMSKEIIQYNVDKKISMAKIKEIISSLTEEPFTINNYGEMRIYFAKIHVRQLSKIYNSVLDTVNSEEK